MTVIDDKHAKLGGNSGALGKAVDPEGPDPNDVDWQSRRYERGMIFSNPDDVTFAVYGKIFDRYETEGGSASFLPASDELHTPRHDARVSWFAGGGVAIVWQSGVGTHRVHGDIATSWRRNGSVFGDLGLPVTEEVLDPGGWHQDFSGGSIYGNGTGRTFALYGAILERWLSLGGPASPLGWPTTHELRAEDRRHRFTKFQNGTIRWSPEHGVEVLP